ncbi:ABC transporter ATP-binding protein [Microbacterium caowuchunii]|uniref:ABC transporter ATP-binding protein n=1 Tax=Microbacterium caowuchunii TaxID=2614638 RepID=UPI001EE8252F|nr:ABC transporter ATP-binding protein [Microbacterium caowuchunii]
MSEQTLTDAPSRKNVRAPRSMIVADNAHVEYRVYASGKKLEANDSILSLRAIRGGRGLQTVPALRGVTFTATEGETIGVVGHNGSGKSTLFRAMSGLVPTSEGTIWARDRPVLLGVNAALVPELSGENNIKLGLLAMGFTADEAAAHVDEIADFAELNEFIHHPMRTYSSGMGARLRFAIASAKAHSILLIDEALSVGDRRFKQKSESRIRELRESAGLVMIVSHSVNSLKDTCDRVLWVHKGELRADGPAVEVIDDYVKWTKQPGSKAVGAASAVPSKTPTARPATKKAKTAAKDARAAVGEGDDEVAALLGGLVQGDAVGAYPAGAATSAATGPVRHESSRDIARRERHNRAVRQVRKRRIAAIISTAAAIVIAVAAGATIAIIANQPDPAQRPLVIRTPTPRPADQASPPLVRTFGANTGTVVCESPEAVGEVQLTWEVEDAATIVLAGGVPGSGVMEPIAVELPPAASVQPVGFPCANESFEYTLSAENVAGARVSSVVTVVRELAPAPEEEPQPRQSQAPAPAPARPAPPAQQPATPVNPEPQPQPQPEPPPTTEPVPEPSVEPEPEPPGDSGQTPPAPSEGE